MTRSRILITRILITRAHCVSFQAHSIWCILVIRALNRCFWFLKTPCCSVDGEYNDFRKRCREDGQVISDPVSFDPNLVPRTRLLSYFESNSALGTRLLWYSLAYHHSSGIMRMLHSAIRGFQCGKQKRLENEIVDGKLTDAREWAKNFWTFIQYKRSLMRAK